MKSRMLVALGFAILVAVLRSSSFFFSMENWDESIYLIVARRMLDGHPLYSDVWDHKPPGIYFLFALGELVFGRSTLSIRILASLAEWATCLGLVRLGTSLRDQRTGILAAFLYAVLCLGSGGLSANTELFLAPLVVWAFALFYAAPAHELFEKPRTALLIGLAAGLALQIKYTVALEFLALVISVAAAAGRLDGRLFRFLALAAIGPVVGFAVSIGYFALSGNLADYVYANVTANVRYAANAHFDVQQLAWMTYRRVREAPPIWMCLALAPFYAAFLPGLDRETQKRLAGLLLWQALAIVTLCSTGRLFAHYFLPLIPPLSMIAALVLMITIEGESRSDRGDRSFRLRTVLLFVLVLFGPVATAVVGPLARTARIVDHRWARSIPNWGDEAALIADYLRPRLGEGDRVYVADFQPIVYELIPVAPPTRFVFPTHLIDPAWIGVAPVDPLAEVRRILDTEPLYIVREKDRPTPFYAILNAELREHYRHEQKIEGVDVYRRLDGNASP